MTLAQVQYGQQSYIGVLTNTDGEHEPALHLPTAITWQGVIWQQWDLSAVTVIRTWPLDSVAFLPLAEARQVSG